MVLRINEVTRKFVQSQLHSIAGNNILNRMSSYTLCLKTEGTLMTAEKKLWIFDII